METQNAYTAQCKNENGASWLQVSLAEGVGPEEASDLLAHNELAQELVAPEWGLHLYDVNIALGNLVNTVAIQAQAYAFAGLGQAVRGRPCRARAARGSRSRAQIGRARLTWVGMGAIIEELGPADVSALGSRVASNISAAVKMPEGVLREILVALMADGHVLIEDHPGVGKTALARALARSIDAGYARIQCTSDLLPSDVVGTNVFNQLDGRFEFRPGPVFAHLVLVDEINRASPRTQSGLLECMQEGHVTVDGESHPLASPFMVLATQNPVEYEGTYPLPEAQLDRFMVRVSLGYPSPGQEAEMLVRPRRRRPRARPRPPSPRSRRCGSRSGRARSCTRARRCGNTSSRWSGTHASDPRVELGASPRAGLMLLKAAKASAVLDGRDHALPDDVKAMAPAVLAHRLMLAPDGARRSAASRWSERRSRRCGPCEPRTGAVLDRGAPVLDSGRVRACPPSTSRASRRCSRPRSPPAGSAPCAARTRVSLGCGELSRPGGRDGAGRGRASGAGGSRFPPRRWCHGRRRGRSPSRASGRSAPTRCWSRRGRQEVGPARVRVADPLGICVREILSESSRGARAAPRSPAERAGSRAGRGQRHRSRREAPQEVDSLRVYRPGSPASRIHWPTVARSGVLMEHGLRAEDDARVLVEVDALHPASEDALDQALRAAASLCVHLARRGGCLVLLPDDARASPVGPDLRAWPALHARLAADQAGRRFRGVRAGSGGPSALST